MCVWMFVCGCVLCGWMCVSEDVCSDVCVWMCVCVMCVLCVCGCV